LAIRFSSLKEEIAALCSGIAREIDHTFRMEAAIKAKLAIGGIWISRWKIWWS